MTNSTKKLNLYLEAMAPAENPANMTEWIAPILVQASMEATARGEMGM